ncbi:MAG: CotH kinase family protein, partial [Chitinophagales bacterium]
DEVVPGFIHTNFKLTQTKYEKLVLADPSSVIVDSLSLQLTQKNHSRGRTSNGGMTWGVFTQATPAFSNGASYTDYVAKPEADIQQGFYTASQVVTITDPDPTASVYYTTDGSTPTTASSLYTGPVTISITQVLRARAFSTNLSLLPSLEEVKTYFINAPNHDPHYYVISISSTDFDDLFNSWGTNSIDAYIEFWDKQHTFQFGGMGKVDPHGNDSWAFPQKGIDFEMEDDYGYAHTMPFPIFTEKDRNSYDHIIMKAGASDNYPFSWGVSGGAHMRDAYAATLALRQHLEIDVRTYEPMIMYINGEYWGVYDLREKVDEPDFTSHYFNQEEKDIDVLKYWGGLQVPYGSDTAWDNLYYFMQANSMLVQSNYDYVNDRLNFKNVIDYMAANTYMVDCDWINWNSAWWRGRNPSGERTKWTYTFWDEDNILGLGQNYSGWSSINFDADPCDLSQTFSNAGPDMGAMDMLNWLMINPDFKNQYINRFADLLNTSLSCDTMIALTDWFVEVLTPEMPGQIARWGGSMSDWETNVDYLQNFITQRCAFIDSGIVNCYDVTGPYDLTVSVYPAGVGDVTVNTVHPVTYPWYGSYFGNVDLGFKAIPHPNSNMAFDYWEVNNNIVSPNINADSMFLNLITGDTIVAHFKNILPAFGLTLDVAPSGSGTITIEGTTPAVYPFSSDYLSGNEINLTAGPGSGYEFDYWELSNHFVNPNSTSPTAYFSLFTSDNIVAHFKKITGIEESHITSLNVYPTLTRDKFILTYELTRNTDLTINLFSIAGETVKDLTGEDEELKREGRHKSEISMKQDHLSPGVYFLQFTSPGLSKTFKIVMLPY